MGKDDWKKGKSRREIKAEEDLIKRLKRYNAGDQRAYSQPGHKGGC